MAITREQMLLVWVEESQTENELTVCESCGYTEESELYNTVEFMQRLRTSCVIGCSLCTEKRWLSNKTCPYCEGFVDNEHEMLFYITRKNNEIIGCEDCVIT